VGREAGETAGARDEGAAPTAGVLELEVEVGFKKGEDEE
jgi:hypothetical protein